MQRLPAGQFQSINTSTTTMNMKKQTTLLLLACTILWSACLKDQVKQSYVYYRPVYKTKQEVRNEIQSVASREIVAPGKLFYKDGFVFLNDLEKGVHIIDITNPSAPRKAAFVAIPGCVDLAVRGNTLYADLSTDLVAIDISNPLQVKLTQVLEGVFPHRYYSSFVADTTQVITSWVRVDTTVTSSDPIFWGISQREFDTMVGAFSNSTRGAKVSNGVGGSMARFALSDDRLYTVSHSDIKIFNTSDAPKPSFIKQVNIAAWDIETIFPFKNNLFLGSQTGMYIFNITNKDNPVQLSKFEHARVCDPVVADDKYAYVTLRDGTECRGFINQLDVVDIQNLVQPRLVKSYSMTNPHGLSVDDHILLICDGADGLRIMDASNKQAVKQLSHLTGFTTYDVIALNGLALVSATNGLHLVDYTQPTAPVIKGSVAFAKK